MRLPTQVLKKDRSKSHPFQKQCCVTRTAYCARSRRAVGVDSVYSSWRQKEKDAIVCTNSEKDRLISLSSKKYCETRIARRARNWFAGGVGYVHSSWRQKERNVNAIQIQKKTGRSHSHPLQKYVAIQGSHIV